MENTQAHDDDVISALPDTQEMLLGDDDEDGRSPEDRDPAVTPNSEDGRR